MLLMPLVPSCVSVHTNIYYQLARNSTFLSLLHVHEAALDSGNKMLSHYHWGVYGLTEKDKWSCCKSADRVCQGCYPVGSGICVVHSFMLTSV